MIFEKIRQYGANPSFLGSEEAGLMSARRLLRAMRDDFSASFITRHGCDFMHVKMHFQAFEFRSARRLLPAMAGHSASFITRHGQEVPAQS